MKDLLTLTLKDFLNQVGAENHVPGSGSASALLAILSAQLQRTVIGLTNNLEGKRRESYSKHIPELLKIKEAIEDSILKKLEYLFQKDSDEFDKAIKFRKQRDRDTSSQGKKIAATKADEALVTSTELPIEIAELALKLALHAENLFYFGFQEVRGDSSVAFNSALAAVSSCLNIIELNSTKLLLSKKTEVLLERKRKIRLQYNELFSKTNRMLNILEEEADKNWKYRRSIKPFLGGNLSTSLKNNSEIESIVKNLQNTIWMQRESIWKGKKIENTLEILNPKVVLEKVMNYAVVYKESLGFYEHDYYAFEIAGIINKKEGWVEVSKAFSKETQSFTLAHELGHAILHNQIVMHRDRPVDGSGTLKRSPIEVQADKFASYFLMPAKLVRTVFFDRFGTLNFAINQDTAFGLNYLDIGYLRQKCGNRRGLANLLASNKYFAGQRGNTLADIFGVSIKTMAIRLEELDLVDF